METLLARPLVWALVLGVSSLFLTALTYLCAWWRLRKRVPMELLLPPPISVLKPLKGIDDDLYANLVAFARQTHPRYEIVIAIADADDPALGIARRFRADFPHLPVKIVLGAPDIGLNAKISNLVAASAHAQYPILLVSDADVRPAPDYLMQMVAQLSAGADMVYSPLAAQGECDFGAALDNAELSGRISASMAAAAQLLGMPCVVGKSMMMRAQALDTIGGFSAFKDVLAEDYLMGRAFVTAGMRAELCHTAVGVHKTRRSVRALLMRHLRWAQMRRRMTLPAFLLEPLQYPTVALVAAMVLAWAEGPLQLPMTPAVLALTPQRVIALALMGIVLRALLDGWMIRCIRGRRAPWWMLALVPLKDIMMVGLWLVASVYDTVNWRGRRMRILAGTALAPIAPHRGRRAMEAIARAFLT